jgi:phospholipid/cholesterol/gamma-HCH transport system substrate-binding protein
MNPKPWRDTVVGLFVFAGLAALGYLSLSVGGLTLRSPYGQRLYGLFDEAGGIEPRARVVIAGVKVGEVRAVTLGKDFRARVDMDLDPTVKLDADTIAAIYTQGILGDRYVALQPGGSDEVLKSGQQITHTEQAFILERMIGKLIYHLTSDSGGSDAGKDKDKGGGAPKTQP